MKNCKDCVFASWDRSKNGNLHPSGDGKCTYEYKLKELPRSFYWFGSPPELCGGYINRKKEISKHCPYYTESIE